MKYFDMEQIEQIKSRKLVIRLDNKVSIEDTINMLKQIWPNAIYNDDMISLIREQCGLFQSALYEDSYVFFHGIMDLPEIGISDLITLQYEIF